MSATHPASSIDEVIDRLDAILRWASDHGSRLGYFPALYRKVTMRVRDGIQGGLFENADRMERLDVAFANRYLEAFDACRANRPTTASWRMAFDTTSHYWPIVLQHLLLGMNAHINLDLGIAAAATMRGQDLEAIHRDFDAINTVLAALVDEVSDDLADVWLTLTVMNRLLGDTDNAVINFSMDRARDEAWRFAGRLSALPDVQWNDEITAQDDRAVAVGRLVRVPGMVLSGATHIVRLGEVRDVTRVIALLS